jgi:RNA polymerase sigma-70 factor (ECF subfamily)
MTNWDAIAREHGPMVWSTLWRLLADHTDVEECFQETFISALSYSRGQVVECWPALLCTLATARAMDRLRTRYRIDGLRKFMRDGGPIVRRLSDAATSEPSPEEHAIAVELSEQLRVALAQLPETQAEAFYLHAICGWSHRELGEWMNMTDNAIGVTIHRARKRLRQLLAGDE